MTDIAELGFRINSRDAQTATGRLDRMTSAAGRTERQAQSLNRTMMIAAKGVAAFGGALVAGIGFNRAFQGAMEFNSALAEVSTLLPQVDGEIQKIDASSRALAKQFGTSTTDQARAFYQAISAGAGDAAEATQLLTVANEAAVGGVTNVFTAVDILTTATNAYAQSNLSAADAADILFVGVRAGKTNFDQLSSTLGRVIPQATAVGIGFDEVVAATAALTTQGQSTEMAVTGISGALTQLLQPSSQAEKLAKKLGIEFTAAKASAMGLADFMTYLVEETGGSNEVMAELFGSVEALRAVFSLAGQGGVKFNEVMDQMAERAGAAQEAADRVEQSLTQRFNVAMKSLGVQAQGAGDLILAGLVPPLEALAKVLTGAEDRSRALEATLKGVATGVAVLATASIVKLTASIIASSAAVGTFTTALKLLTVQGGAAIVMSRTLAATLAFFSGPLGWAVLAAGAAGAAVAFLTLRDNGEAVNETLERSEQSVKGAKTAIEEFDDFMSRNEPVKALGDQADFARQEVAELIGEVKGLSAELVNLALAKQANLSFDLMDQIAQANDVLNDLERQRAKALARNQSAAAALQSMSGGFGEFSESDIATGTEELTGQIDEQRKALDGLMDRWGQLMDMSLSGDIESFLTAADRATVGANDNSPADELEKEVTAYDRVVASLSGAITELQAARGLERDIVANLMQAGLSPDDRTSAAAQNVIDLTKALRDLEDQGIIDDFNERMHDQSRILREVGEARDVLAAKIDLQARLQRDLTKAEAEGIESAVLQNNRLADQARMYDRIRGEVERYRRELEAIRTLEMQGQITSVQADAAQGQLGLAQDGMQLGSDLGFMGADIAMIQQQMLERNALIETLEAERLMTHQQAAAARVEVERRAMAEIANLEAMRAEQVTSVIHSSTQQGLDALRTLVGESSALYKVMFLANQAAAIANAVVNTEVAATRALAELGPILGPPAAMAVRAAGYMSVAAIAAQTVAGFREGGYTGDGPLGGVAGVVHGQEYVMDAASTRRIGRENLDAMRRGSMPSNDNGKAAGNVVYIDARGASRDAVADIKKEMQTLGYRIEQTDRSIPKKVVETLGGNVEMSGNIFGAG